MAARAHVDRLQGGISGIISQPLDHMVSILIWREDRIET
jgi:hypothetical protein